MDDFICGSQQTNTVGALFITTVNWTNPRYNSTVMLMLIINVTVNELLMLLEPYTPLILNRILHIHVRLTLDQRHDNNELESAN